MKPRIYVDTSVLGGCFDIEFAETSRRLVDRFRAGQAVMVLSELTIQELTGAPDPVRDLLASIGAEHIDTLRLAPEATDLSEHYLEAGVLPPRMRADALHIAFATIARVDVLVSWNFKHVVNLQRIRGYNSVNLREGYPLLEIRSPREILDDE